MSLAFHAVSELLPACRHHQYLVLLVFLDTVESSDVLIWYQHSAWNWKSVGRVVASATDPCQQLCWVDYLFLEKGAHHPQYSPLTFLLQRGLAQVPCLESNDNGSGYELSQWEEGRALEFLINPHKSSSFWSQLIVNWAEILKSDKIIGWGLVADMG